MHINEGRIILPSAKRFINNKRGIVTVVVLGITGIIVAFMVWIVTMYPVSLFWDQLDTLGVYPVEAEGTMTLLHNIAGYVLITLVVGLLVWMVVSAFRRVDQTVPIQV